MIAVYIEPELLYSSDIASWMVGWLYMKGYTFTCGERDGRWEIHVYAREVEGRLEPADLIGLAVEVVPDLHRFLTGLESYNAVVVMCDESDNCVQLSWEDMNRVLFGEGGSGIRYVVRFDVL
jgi:hypothetical protein